MDLAQIIAFRDQNIGAHIRFQHRALGSNSEWSETLGVIEKDAVRMDDPESGLFLRVDFPSEEYEYRCVEVRRQNGSYGRLDPSPPTSRAQSRAQSQQRQEELERFLLKNAASSESQRDEIRRTQAQQIEQALSLEAAAATQRNALLAATERNTQQTIAIGSEASEQRRLMDQARIADARAAAEDRRQKAEKTERLLAESAERQTQLMETMNQILFELRRMGQQTPATPLQQQNPTTQQRTQRPEALAQQYLGPQTAAEEPERTTTIGRRQEFDIFFPEEWDFTDVEKIGRKKVELMHFFQIHQGSSPFRWRAWNGLHAWMEDTVGSENALDQFGRIRPSCAAVGKVLLENLRATVLQEEKRINARALYDQTASVTGDRLGEVAAQLERAATRTGRTSRGGGRRYNNGFPNNNNNGNNNSSGQQQGNFRGPARQ